MLPLWLGFTSSVYYVTEIQVPAMILSLWLIRVLATLTPSCQSRAFGRCMALVRSVWPGHWTVVVIWWLSAWSDLMTSYCIWGGILPALTLLSSPSIMVVSFHPPGKSVWHDYNTTSHSHQIYYTVLQTLLQQCWSLIKLKFGLKKTLFYIRGLCQYMITSRDGQFPFKKL